MNISLFIIVFIIVVFIKNESKKNNKKTRKNKKPYFNNTSSYKKNLKPTNHKSQYNSFNKNHNQEKIVNTTKIAEHFNISARELNKIFEELEWIYKKDRWWLATELGEKQGAKEYYDVKRKTKYIKWDSSVKDNSELIDKISNKKPKQNDNKQETEKKMTNKEKKEKGDAYEAYIANFFREQGYVVWEHGKEKGVHDSSIDLIIKKEQCIFFVQCKNWDKWKINHKEVKATRTDVREYLKKNKILWNLIKDYNNKILYITPKECLTKSAYTYIKENSEIVEYQVIPIK